MRDYWRINPNVTYYDNTTRQGWIALVHVARSTASGGGWRREIGLDYRYEDYTINDVETDSVNELVPEHYLGQDGHRRPASIRARAIASNTVSSGASPG